MGGISLDEGLYRVYTRDEAIKWTSLALQQFTRFKGGAVVFSADWLGRQFAVDLVRKGKGGHLCLLFDVSFGEGLELPYTVEQLHTQGLIDDAEAALAGSAYREWRGTSGDDIALTSSECVGYRHPLVLGGQDRIDNTERTDMEVYRDLTGQLRQSTSRVPTGTPVTQVKAGKRRLFRR